MKIKAYVYQKYTTMFYSIDFLMKTSTIVLTLVKINQPTKYMLKVAKEMLAKGKSSKFKLKQKSTRTTSAFFDVQLHIK